MKPQFVALVAGAALASAILAWYALAQDESSGDTRMRVAFFPNIAHAVPIVGVEMGIFEESLGDAAILEHRLFDSGPQTIEALFSGSIDMAYVGPGPAINGFLKSADDQIRILAGAASGGSSMVVHPGSTIESPADLSGKRVAAPQIGNSQDISLRNYLEENGLGPAEKGGTVTVLNIANPDTYTLFAKGEVDAAWVPEPWATILVQELGGQRLFHEEELWEGGSFASVVLVVRDGFVDENGQAVSRWLEAHHSAIRWINDNPQDARDSFNRYIQAELGRPFPDEVIDESMRGIRFTADPLVDTIEVFAERADSLGYLGRHGYDLDGLYHDAAQETDDADA